MNKYVTTPIPTTSVVGVCIDLIRLILRIGNHEKGRPWDWGKSFDNLALFAPIVPTAEMPLKMQTLSEGCFWRSVDGEVRQDASLGEQSWNMNHVIAFCSQLITLKAGGLIFPGSPSAVSAVIAGDVFTGGLKIENIGDISITLTAGS